MMLIIVSRYWRAGVVVLLSLGLLVGLAFGCGKKSPDPGNFIPAVSLAAHHGTAGPDITCASGYFRITNYYISGASAGVTGEGVGNDVIYTNPAGSCWHAINIIVDGHGYDEKQYQNEGGSCLDFESGYMNLAPCNFQNLAQFFYGLSFTPGLGWVMGYEDPYGKKWDMGHSDCAIGNIIGADTSPTCLYWNFPS